MSPKTEFPKAVTITVDPLARIEGEAALDVKLRDGKVHDVKLRIFEPPRFFEAFLRGRAFTEAPDITARICGICPIAYQMASVHAMEHARGVTISPEIRALRRLLYCGEWIESHALHIHLLHAPDFLGYEDGVAMAADHPEVVTAGLMMKKLGNELMSVIGGREVHPVNVRVGGFYKAPSREALRALLPRLQEARDAAERTVAFTAGLTMHPLERDMVFVAVSHPTEYPMNEGRILASDGLDIDVSEYEQHYHEDHRVHSNALHSHRDENLHYAVGPLARFNLHFAKLTPRARHAAEKAGVTPPVTNPFRSIVVRSIELLHALDEAVQIIEGYVPPDPAWIPVEPGPGTGAAATEAPRGMIYHRYTLDDDGLIQKAVIVPPTAQNLPTIEDDLREFLAARLDWPKDKLTWHCEQTVRNYDPCISCATHSLRLHFVEETAADGT